MKQQLPALGIRLGKSQSLVLCVAVFISLAAPALIQLAGWASDPSVFENRRPAPLPTLPKTIEEVGAFRDSLVSFVDDNFGLRSELIVLNFMLHSLIGVSANPNEIIGKGGWWLLKDDRTDPTGFGQFRGLNRFSEPDLDNWIDTMERYKRWLGGKGISFMILVAPNQQTIYPERMPNYVNRVWPETRLEQLSRRLRERGSDLPLIDPRQDLWGARKNGILYHRYENHWNPLGAFVAYTTAMREAVKLFPEIVPLQLSDFTIQEQSIHWKLRLLPELEPVLRLKKESRIAATEALSIDHVNISRTTSNVENTPGLLVYGDSFAEGGLMPFFFQTFKSTMFVSTNVPFPYSVIEKYAPKLVILEFVERFLSLPRDDNRILDTAQAPTLDTLLKESQGISGYVDALSVDKDEIRFSGWAIDASAKAPAKAVYAYLDAQAVAVAIPSDSRPDVASGMSSQIVGFQLLVPRDVYRRSADHRLRFFTLNPSNKLYELEIIPPVLRQLEEINK
jgi:hypothetical protein